MTISAISTRVSALGALVNGETNFFLFKGPSFRGEHSLNVGIAKQKLSDPMQWPKKGSRVEIGSPGKGSIGIVVGEESI